MNRYRYKKIDAFTSMSSAGNPAACLYLDRDGELSPEEMLMIAKQHKGFVSEMVYCSPSKAADAKLTYYSSECEVDFCGHGTIACLYELIRSDPKLMMKKEIKVETNRKGVITVYNEINQEDSIYITAPLPRYPGNCPSLGETEEALGLREEDLSGQHPMDVIDAGLVTLIVPIADWESEIQTFPNEEKLKDFCLAHDLDLLLIYTLATADPKNQAHTRVFAPKFGYLEDPATGSGNSAFGYYLLKNSLWTGDALSLEQGGADRAFNRIQLRTKNDRVLFGGGATLRISGEYYLS